LSAKEFIAVMDLEAVGATPAQASAMTDRLREELLNTGRYTLVERSQMKQILDEQAFQQSGCTTNECAVQVGKVLGVRKLVTGKITNVGTDQWLLSAQIVDVESGETERATSVQFEGVYFAMLRTGIQDLALKLAASKPDSSALAAALPPPAPSPAVPRAAPPAPVPVAAPVQPAQAEAKEGGGVKWYWWALGGAVIVAAVAGGGGSKSSSKKSSGGGSSTGGMSYSW
jgi:hypothetical protein